MATINLNSFSNILEYTSKDFQTLLKSKKDIIVITPQNLKKFIQDSQQEIIKANESSELVDLFHEKQTSLLKGLVEVDVLHPDNLFKARVYISLPSLLNEEGTQFMTNSLTQRLDIAGCNVGIEIEKGKKASVGEIRTWGDLKYQKTAQGWVSIKDSNSSEDSSKKAEAKKSPSLEKNKSLYDEVQQWSGDDYSHEMIDSVYDYLVSKEGLNDKDFKIAPYEGSRARQSENVWKKVDELVSKMRPDIEHKGLGKSGIKDVLWGIVMSKNN